MGNTQSSSKPHQVEAQPLTLPSADQNEQEDSTSDTIHVKSVTKDRQSSRRRRRRQVKHDGEPSQPRTVAPLPTPPADPQRVAASSLSTQSKRRPVTHWTKKLDTRLLQALKDAEKGGSVLEHTTSDRSDVWDDIAAKLRQSVPQKRRKTMNAHAARQRALWLKRRDRQKTTQVKTGPAKHNNSILHDTIVVQRRQDSGPVAAV